MYTYICVMCVYCMYAQCVVHTGVHTSSITQYSGWGTPGNVQVSDYISNLFLSEKHSPGCSEDPGAPHPTLFQHTTDTDSVEMPDKTTSELHEQPGERQPKEVSKTHCHILTCIRISKCCWEKTFGFRSV